jgi:hypothetical protein
MVTITTEIYYGMFSDEGNMAVHTIVTVAKSQNLSWADTYQALCNLASINPDSFGEATDTVVREMVYDAIGADQRGECFYI